MEVQKEVFIHGRRTIRGENKCASKWNIFILKREDYMYRTLTFCKFGRYLKGFKYLYQYISIIKMKKINMFNLKNHSNWKKKTTAMIRTPFQPRMIVYRPPPMILTYTDTLHER